MRKFDWWLAPFLIVMITGAALGFWIGTAFADDWNAAATQRIEIRKACMDGNDRACGIYEMEYDRRGRFL